MKIRGTADLPLHSGHVPPWMLRIMEKLAMGIVKFIVEEKGPDAVISLLSDPLWFQAFNNVIGMDWDSSGSTTVIIGILKSITWRENLGFLILGGKGSRMRSIPQEAARAEEIFDVESSAIIKFSKSAARIDSSFIQDGYELYHHSLIVSETGRMLVIQQGMNAAAGMARRYHVIWESLEKPHAGVAGKYMESIILNATGRESRSARRVFLEILSEPPRTIRRMLEKANQRIRCGPQGLELWMNQLDNRRECNTRPYYKPVLPSPRLLKNIEEVTRWSPSSEEDLLLAPGLGPKTLRALALIADIIFGVPTGYRDPVTHPLDPFLYAYAIGGKDGIPYSFDPRTAVKALQFLEEALEEAKIGDKYKIRALQRLRRRLREYSSLPMVDS